MGIGSDYKLVDRRAKPDPESEEGALKEGVYTTIGAAIKAGGGTIVLLPDIYEETVMLEGGEKILSLAAAKNELEGDAGEDLPALTGDGVSTIQGVSFHTVTLLGDAQLIGITVQQRGPGKWFAVACAGGSATLTRCDIDGASSSCVGLTAVGASPTFTECKIHGSFTGAGVCAFGGAKATFEKCEIYNNKFSGVEVSGENTEIALKDCIIHSNRRDGVLVWDNAKCTLEGNQLRRNYHCGLEVRDKATAIATANMIETNDFGVLIALHGTCNLTENSICGNLITGVEISKADVGEEGAEPPPLSELTANKINCNLESGIKIWHQGAAKLDKNMIEANLDRILLTPRSRKKIVVGECEAGQPRGGCYAKSALVSSAPNATCVPFDLGSNRVREYSALLVALLNPPPSPAQHDITHESSLADHSYEEQP